ncbi:hypothetical protein F511_39190 [Dorcoceras hygrometricum]|uniref:Uncharacterized protein n=1 Tax=Dorcoceras hygrometricum TaxID=472368 RepID=A0A2Z7BSP6_9LAMI|nr:hypothetical protein F511_39190 [Dorcoceras hygrometricum]
MLISSVLLVQPDEGVSDLVVDRIGVNYRNLPRRAGFFRGADPDPQQRLDDISGATLFELVATLRFEVATGTSREKRLHCFVLATGYPATGIVSRATSFGFSSCGNYLRKTWSSNLWYHFPYIEISSLSFLILRTLEHCSAVSFSGDFPSFPVVVLLVRGSVGLLSRSSSISYQF